MAHARHGTHPGMGAHELDPFGERARLARFLRGGTPRPFTRWGPSQSNGGNARHARRRLVRVLTRQSISLRLHGGWLEPIGQRADRQGKAVCGDPATGRAYPEHS